MAPLGEAKPRTTSVSWPATFIPEPASRSTLFGAERAGGYPPPKPEHPSI